MQKNAGRVCSRALKQTITQPLLAAVIMTAESIPTRTSTCLLLFRVKIRHRKEALSVLVSVSDRKQPRFCNPGSKQIVLLRMHAG